MSNQKNSGIMSRVRPVRILAVAVLLIVGICSVAQAESTWNAGTGDWQTDANWTGGLPDSGDLVYVNNGGTAQIGGGYAAVARNYSVGTGTIELSGTTSSLTATGTHSYLGNGGTGLFTQTGGLHDITGFGLYIGQSGGNGTYDLIDGQFNATYLRVGENSVGTLNQSGGTTTVTNSIAVGRHLNSVGTYNISGGQVLSPNFRVGGWGGGAGGSGECNQTGGTNKVTGDLRLSGEGATGTYNLTAGTLEIGGEIADGSVGIGNFNIEGPESGYTLTVGGNTNVDNFGVGNAVGTNGEFTLVSGKTLSTRNTYVGNDGTGIFTQADGIHNDVGDLWLGQNATGVGTYTLTGGTLNVTGDIKTGAGTGNFHIDSSSTLNVSGGNIDVTTFGLGNAAGTTGVYTLTASKPAISAQTEFVGNDGNGTFTQTGGSNTVVGDLWISKNTPSGSSTYRITGGTLDVGGDIKGGSAGAESRFYVDGLEAAHDISVGGQIDVFRFAVGSGSSDTGQFTIGGSVTSVDSEWQYIGFSGTGTLTQTGGANTLTSGTGAIYLGHAAGSNGTYDLSDGTLTARYMRVGERGTGVMNQSGGSVDVVANNLIIGRHDGGHGTYSLSGGALSALTEYIGGESNAAGTNSIVGVFNQTGGTHTVAGNLICGLKGGTGTYNLSDGTLGVGTHYLGYSSLDARLGSGTFTQDGGTHIVTGGLRLGHEATTTGTYHLNDGLLRAASITKGAGTAIFNFNGGTLRNREGVDLTVSVPDVTLGTSGTPTVEVDASRTASFTSKLTGSGSLTKTGDGALVLSNAANDFGGDTTIDAGTLRLTGSSTLDGSSTITVAGGATFDVSGVTGSDYGLANGQTLTGGGDVLGALSIADGSILSPGNSPGTISLQDTTWAGGGHYLWEINDGAGTQGADPGWDSVNIDGTLDITATAGNPFVIDITSLQLDNTPGLADFDGQVEFWVIATASGGISGFNPDNFDLNTDAFQNGFGGFQITQAGNSIVLGHVPEPSTLLLLLLALVSSLLGRSRHRHSR